VRRLENDCGRLFPSPFEKGFELVSVKNGFYREKTIS